MTRKQTESDKQQSKLRYAKLISDKSKDAPQCACGCGQKTLWSIRTKSYGRFLFNHQLPDLSNSWSERIEEIIRGTVLGDGHLDPRRGRSGKLTGLARLSLRHSTKRQLPYIQWLRNELDAITTSKIRIRQTPESFGKEIAEFSTVSVRQLFSIWLETYREDGTKIVTERYLDTLTDFSVAIWWCDDGGNGSLSTHSFTVEENELIAYWFNKRYGTELFVDRDKRVNLPFISCNSISTRVLGRVIFKYVEQSLWYKFSRFLPELLAHESEVSSRSESLPPMTLE